MMIKIKSFIGSPCSGRLLAHRQCSSSTFSHVSPQLNKLMGFQQQQQQRRSLSASAVSIINPTLASVADIVKKERSKLDLSLFDPKAVLVVATPQFSESLIDYVVGPASAAAASSSTSSSTSSDSSSNTEEPQTLQIVGAVVDTIGFGSQRNGVSVLFIDKKFEILEAHELDQSFGDSSKRLGRSGADLTNKGIVSARQTWHLPQGFLSIEGFGTGEAGDQAAGKKELAVPLANTLFTSGLPSTLLFNHPGHDLNGVLLGSLQLRISNSVNTNTNTTIANTNNNGGRHLSVLSTSAAAPLLNLNTGSNLITDAKSNMVKSIDGRPAASFLESSKTLMEFNPRAHSGTGEKKVFAELTTTTTAAAAAAAETAETTAASNQKSRGKTQRFQVTAGGGGAWSPRASMLVLEPQARPEPGMIINFQLAHDVLLGTHGDHRTFIESNGISTAPTLEEQDHLAPLNRVVLECAPIHEFTEFPDLISYPKDSVLPGMFSLGSEQGFLLDDCKYSVPGEVIQLNF